MESTQGIPAPMHTDVETGSPSSVAAPSSAEGLNSLTASLVAFWYGLTAAGAMSTGFAFLYKGSGHDYSLAQNLMWAVGIGIGVTVGVYLARGSRVLVGVIPSVLLSGLLLALLLIGGGEANSGISIFGFRPSVTQFLIGIAGLTLIFGLLGTAAGIALRKDESLAGLLLGIRSRHWFWLWVAVYAWVAILPTGIYYVWLEIISSGYVLIHPSLWLSEAWTEGGSLTFGVAGFAALAYGINLSVSNVSAYYSSQAPTKKRVLKFLLGTLILAGPVANILFLIAIHSLKQLPDGITANPWWILR